VLPTAPEIDALRADVHAAIGQDEIRRGGQRLSSWQRKLQDYMKRGAKEAYECVKNDMFQGDTYSATRSNGTYTANVSEIFSVLHNKWNPVFNAYTSEQDPDIPQFFREYAPELEGLSQPMDWTEFTEDQLDKVVDGMNVHKSGGLDSWARREWRASGRESRKRLRTIILDIESSSFWPSSSRRGKIALADKGEGPAAENKRPLTALALLFLTWCRLRMPQVVEWASKWIDASCFSIRGLSASDLWYTIALKVEEALLYSEPLLGLSDDASKAFDRLPRNLTMAIWKHLGAHEKMIGAYSAFYDHVIRHFVIQGVLGPQFTSHTAYFQGDPFAMFCMMTYTSIWGSRIRSIGGIPYSLADDRYSLAKSHPTLQLCANETHKFTVITKQKVNYDKSYAFATNAKLRRQLHKRLRFGGSKIPVRLASRTLGAHIAYAKGKYAGVMKLRAVKAKNRAHRILSSPLDIHGQLRVLEAAAAPIIAFGAEIHEYAGREINAVSTAFLNAWWGRKRTQRAPEVCWMLYTRYWKVEPLALIDWNRFLFLR